jgi:hypothetical protein
VEKKSGNAPSELVIAKDATQSDPVERLSKGSSGSHLMSDHGAQLRWKGQLGSNLTHPACQHSLWEETRVPGENPRLSVER